MVRLAFMFLLTAVSWLPVVAQPCERADFQDEKQLRVLKRFIRECEAKGFLKSDFGIIYLSEWVDCQGQTNWQVWSQTTWQQYPWIAPFRSHCTDCIAPIGWTKVANRLVIRYNSDRSDTLTKAESSCLQKILTDHVTILPPLVPPPKEVPRLDAQGQPVLDKDGKPRMRPYYPDVSTGGGRGHNTHITFKKDGSITKGLSL